MTTSKNGIELIKQFEGVRLTAYKPVTTERYWTIGYGHYGPDVYQGMRITHAQAETYLISDLRKFEAYVNACYLTLTQNQFDALVSFTYNCGAGNLKTLIKNRNIKEIGDALLLYNKAGGKVLNGLTKRRQAERKLFFKGYVEYTVTSDITAVAKDVLSGKYGNGADRRKKLEAAGYDYKVIQAEVNRLIHG